MSVNDGMNQLSTLWDAQTQTEGSARRVYETLRQAILEQVLAPGQRLAEEELAASFGVSRTPVREAMTRLEAEGIVERSSMRTVTVSRLSPKAVNEVFEVREWLDGVVAYLATARINPPRLAELRWINERMRAALNDKDEQALEQTNREFHDALALAAENEFLRSLVDQSRDRTRPLTGSTFGYGDRGAKSVEEHEVIIDLIASGDAEGAAQAARQHMRAAADTRLAMMRDAASESTGTE